MKDLKVSRKSVKDLRVGEMVIVIYKGIATQTFYSREVADWMDDAPSYIEHLFNEEETRSYFKKDDDSGWRSESGTMITEKDYDAVVGLSDGDIKLFDLFGVNYLLLDYEDMGKDEYYWNNLSESTWFANYE